MPDSVLIKGVLGQCPLCQHPPIRHVTDGTGTTCVVCLYMAERDRVEARLPRKVCTLGFQFKLSLREREQAAKADKGSYPQGTICIECMCEWRAHEGYLCPTGDSTFLPLLDADLPFMHFKE